MNHTKFISMLGAFALLFPSLGLSQYVISTVAGGANPNNLPGAGDRGPATAAALGVPCNDVAIDGKGNLYISAGGLIRKVSPLGIISTVAGGGSSIYDGVPATQASLAPTAITVDSAGRLFIADTAFGLYRVRSLDFAGNIFTVAGGDNCCDAGDGGPATAAYIAVPYGLALDASGNLYIAQAGPGNVNLIRQVNAYGTITTVAGGGGCCDSGDFGPATKAYLSGPSGIAVDSWGNLYIAEAGGNRLRMVTTDGTITTLAAVNRPWHVAVDSGFNVFVTQINDATVGMIPPFGGLNTIAGYGTHGYYGDGGAATSAALDRPAGIALDSLGNVYIADATPAIPNVRMLAISPAN